MKLGLAKLFVSASIMATLALGAGCSYIKTTQEARDALRGDVNKLALSAEMPKVDDARSWDEGTWEAPNYNVHMFGPAITEKLRADLTKSGLFAALPAPDSAESKDSPYILKVKITSFALENQGNNVYRVPKVIVNGALLPAFALTNLATMGQVDMAGYVIPSTNLGTKLNASFVLVDKESEVTILDRAYQSSLSLGAVSQRDLFKGSETGEYGVEAGASKADEAIADLADMASRDPSWKYVEQYKAVALAKSAIAESDSPSVTQCETALLLLPMIEKLNYTAKEVKILHDDLVDADIRASLYNETRARSLGYSSPEEMPKDQIIDEDQAVKLLDDISLLTDLVVSDLDTKILEIALDAVIPQVKTTAEKPTENKLAQEVRGDAENMDLPQKPEGGQAAPAAAPAPSGDGAPADDAPVVVEASPEMRDQVSQAMVQTLKGNLLVQNILIDLADKKIGDQWPKMKQILESIDSPVTKRYLASREGN